MITTAVQFSSPRTVELTEIELPPVGEGQASVRALYSGISGGTETLAYRGDIGASLPLDEKLGALAGTFSFPFRYGYSVVGTVEESRCSLEPGTMVFCFHPHQARLVGAGEEMIEMHGFDARLATLLPLVETALQISLDAGAVAHEPVVVLGLGPVGIIAGALLTRVGATVVGSDPLPWRRSAAEAFSISSVDPADLPTTVAELTQGRGTSLVVEASGNTEALSGVLELMAHEGTVLIASWFGTKPVSLALGGAFHRRRLTLRSTQVSSIPAQLSSTWTTKRRRATALRLMQDLPLKKLATHEFPLRRVSAAFRAVDSPSDGLIHAALSYEDD